MSQINSQLQTGAITKDWTVLATEDEATVDMVLSRWLLSDPDNRDVERIVRKMGWVSDNSAEPGNTVPLRSHT